MRVFDLLVPERGRSSVVVEVPHAGTAVPDDVRGELAAPEASIFRDADIWVDRLYADAPAEGAALLVSRISRYVVDLNRAPDDVDALTVPDHPAPRGGKPRGVVWRMTTSGLPALRRPLSYAAFEQRIERYHSPYHAALTQLLGETRERSGFAILLAAHSMPSAGPPVAGAHVDPRSRGATMPDVVPGTRGATTADRRVIDLVDSHFRAAGLSVRHDDPYRGGWTTERYGRPREGLHAIQIELNRALYADEESCAEKPQELAELRALLARLIEKLGQLDLRAPGA